MLQIIEVDEDEEEEDELDEDGLEDEEDGEIYFNQFRTSTIVLPIILTFSNILLQLLQNARKHCNKMEY